MYGDCPVGGVKVTGYITEAARYCAITGGEYSMTGNSGADDEQGACTFKNGAVCDVWDYYNGKCDPDTASASEWQTYNNPEAGFSLQRHPPGANKRCPTRSMATSTERLSLVQKAACRFTGVLALAAPALQVLYRCSWRRVRRRRVIPRTATKLKPGARSAMR